MNVSFDYKLSSLHSQIYESFPHVKLIKLTSHYLYIENQKGLLQKFDLLKVTNLVIKEY